MSTVFGDPVGLLQDPEDVLRIEQQRYVQRVQEEREARLHIREVCQTAWNTFFAEDGLQCSQLVQSLAVVDTVPPPSVTDLISSVDGLVEGTEMHGPGALAFTTWYADTNQLRTRSIPSVLSVLPSAASRAYPKYESCTPSLQNIKYIGDQRVLTFISYADEDGFQKLIPKFARCHRWFAWQTGWVDVDVKLAVINTYLHLQATNVETMQIERYWPRSLPPTAALPDLITTLRRRDLPHWASDALHVCRQDRPVAGTDVFAQVQSINSVFCRHLLCNRAICSTHGLKYPPIRVDTSPMESKDNETMHDEAHKSCGNDCFVEHSFSDFDEPLAEDLDVTGLVKLHPNARPCLLALIAKTSCFNVFHHRCYLVGADQAIPIGQTMHVVNNNQQSFCDHVGPCTLSPDCVCIQRDTYCNRRCRCVPHCSHRFKKCKCDPKEGCKPGSCDCLLAGYECDPDRCPRKKNKHATLGHPKHCCFNMKIQLERLAHSSVRVGSFGLGAFAQDPISRSTLIGQYVAEIVPITQNTKYDDLDKIHQLVNDYRGLNYAFNIENQSYVLDAASVGNITRCLNDPMDPEKANVAADTLYVDMEPKIVFIAAKKIKAREELLLSYGEDYWKKENSEDEGSNPDV
ncbi:hypothetical protein C8Q70DRAFT_461465 [Cubamyces menziesii]|nr:hypothetical protein C8Q70DRAFT_461465 [Cubamyces menziesii]